MTCQREMSEGRLKRWWFLFTRSAFTVGLLSLAWFLFRTGAKPSRAAYPCQRAAAVSGYAWLATYVIPLFPFARVVRGKKINRRAVVLSVVLVLAVAFGWAAVSGGWFARPAAANYAITLSLRERRASSAPSKVFAVQGVTPEDSGVPDLLSLMAEGGLDFYQSDAAGPAASRNGLISANDVVILKTNCQWDKRGGTNTDLLKAVIRAIVDHPDGFTGEIIIADNGQKQYGTSGRGGSFSWRYNNAEDRSQSAQAVVDGFAETFTVSTYRWESITQREVVEYDQDETRDGYVIVQPIDERSGSYVTYPKFQTDHGTYISLKHGVWDPINRTYDNDRLKLINMPVLKPHLMYAVTGCVKHYMGVTSDFLTTRLGARAHDTIGQGGMGTVMAGARFPDLNIMDAVWICLEPGKGPWIAYEDATRLDVVAASTDPVALDVWASKNVLMPSSSQAGFSTSTLDPTGSGGFAQYLRASMEILQEEGFSVTNNEGSIGVYVRTL